MYSTSKTALNRLEHTGENAQNGPNPPLSVPNGSSKSALTFAEAGKLYLDFIRVERGLSKETVYCYASWIHHFERWLEENGYPSPTLMVFNTTVLTRFLHALHDRDLRPRSIRGVFYPLRGLGDYMVETGHIEENPAKKIRMPKKDAAIRLLVSDPEATALWDAAGGIRLPSRAALARAVISVFLYADLRRTETISLHLSDVSTGRRLLASAIW